MQCETNQTKKRKYNITKGQTRGVKTACVTWFLIALLCHNFDKNGGSLNAATLSDFLTTLSNLSLCKLIFIPHENNWKWRCEHHTVVVFQNGWCEESRFVVRGWKWKNCWYIPLNKKSFSKCSRWNQSSDSVNSVLCSTLMFVSVSCVFILSRLLGLGKTSMRYGY